MNHRIEYLDGHRGLAIVLVIFFHAYTRWAEVVPYGSAYAEFPPFKYGWLGVQLFFLISGFVILMTLEKYSSAREFLYRRWLRLFPAMLVCSLVIFQTARYFSERPGGIPTLGSLLPGLTFIEPAWWNKLVGFPTTQLEGSFWSIFVEVKFYLFAALMYYWRGRNFLIGALIAAFGIAVISQAAGGYAEAASFSILNKICAKCSFEYFGWFAAGAAFYVYSRVKTLTAFLGASSIAIVSSVSGAGTFSGTCAAALAISLLFAGSMVSPTIQRILNIRILQFFGFISYPFYLIHQNMMIAIIIKMNHAIGNVPSFWFPLVPVILLSVAAYLIAGYIEPYLKNLIIAILPTGGRKPKRNHSRPADL